MIVAGWGKGVYTSSIWGFQHTFGFERFLYVFPLLILAPLCEEIFMRGFLYRAFRGSYPVELSTLLVVAVTAYTHWDQFRQSGIAAVDITAMTVVQCYLRERTGRLQDCIASHFAFNASGLLFSAMRH
jgi:membrane protease YdiL (CAAX protease family)